MGSSPRNHPMPPDPRILLFDLDGTLVLTGGAGRRALVRAFAELTERSDALDTVDLRGMPDRAILRAALHAIGRGFEPALVDALVARYFECLAEELHTGSGYVVLPGVPALLAQVTGLARVAVGLGTGNFERSARLKLEPGGLNPAFAFGGYGDDHEDRTELVRLGALRGATRLEAKLATCTVLVIGDTPRDVRAAHGIGARCLAVATGGHPADELVAAGAELVVPTLEDPRAAEFLLEG